MIRRPPGAARFPCTGRDGARDSLCPGVATGYLSDSGHLTNALRTNALHLPVMGSGDGGLFSTTADMRRFWVALFEGRIVSTEALEVMTHPRSTTDSVSLRYGLSFWLAAQGPPVSLEG